MSNQYDEADYRRVVDTTEPGQFLPDTKIEIIRPLVRTQPLRHVLFDFDGTLSLIREGWPEVMVPLMVEVLRSTGTPETDEQLHQLAYDFVMELNGKQTIYQMIRLAEEVRQRGGTPQDPLVYKDIYHQRLLARIARRRQGLVDGTAAVGDSLVPYSLELLAALHARGLALYIASGTDEQYVLEEARLLTLDRYVGSRIYGALNDYKAFSKAMVIERILRENQVEGASLVGFGDGYVEIQNIKAVGGTAVAVASDESGRSGEPDPWKRDRLIGAGADIVIPDYQDFAALIAYLWDGAGS